MLQREIRQGMSIGSRQNGCLFTRMNKNCFSDKVRLEEI